LNNNLHTTSNTNFSTNSLNSNIDRQISNSNNSNNQRNDYVQQSTNHEQYNDIFNQPIKLESKQPPKINPRTKNTEKNFIEKEQFENLSSNNKKSTTNTTNELNQVQKNNYTFGSAFGPDNKKQN